jgi:predicted transcriptional regulator
MAKIPLTVGVEPEILVSIEILAERLSLPRSILIRQIITEYIDAHREEIDGIFHQHVREIAGQESFPGVGR